jgi:hypothetical protein
MSGLADPQRKKLRHYNANYTVSNTWTPENGAFIIQGGFYIHDGPDDLSHSGWGSAGCMEVCGNQGYLRMTKFIHQISGSNIASTSDAMVQLTKAGKITLDLKAAKRPTVTP